MSFGERMKCRREALALSRPQLADRLGVSPSAVSNYENGLSFPREDVMLRLFDCLETEPNVLFQDSYQETQQSGLPLSEDEKTLLRQYRQLPAASQQTVRSVIAALWACREEPAPTKPSPP